MRIARILNWTAWAAGAVMVMAGLQTSPASAQLFWDWGGGNAVGGSGRETVSFSPQYAKGQIIVSFGDRRLYYITQTGQALSYPIAIPREQSRWEGVTTVSDKRVNPSWTPTPTMVAENPRLPRWVPGGHPMNPLGVRALYLGSSAYRIHGTDAPWTIGTAVSKGCIRMYNQDVLDLYPRIPVGTKVTVTWNRFKTSGETASNSTSATKTSAYKASTTNPPSGDGGFFSLFNDEEPAPVEKPRRQQKPKNPRSASNG
jgi:hypothetical protein